MIDGFLYYLNYLLKDPFGKMELFCLLMPIDPGMTYMSVKMRLLSVFTVTNIRAS